MQLQIQNSASVSRPALACSCSGCTPPGRTRAIPRSARGYSTSTAHIRSTTAWPRCSSSLCRNPRLVQLSPAQDSLLRRRGAARRCEIHRVPRSNGALRVRRWCPTPTTPTPTTHTQLPTHSSVSPAHIWWSLTLQVWSLHVRSGGRWGPYRTGHGEHVSIFIPICPFRCNKLVAASTSASSKSSTRFRVEPPFCKLVPGPAEISGTVNGRLRESWQPSHHGDGEEEARSQPRLRDGELEGAATVRARAA
jgi:hypothetical protein